MKKQDLVPSAPIRLGCSACGGTRRLIFKPLDTELEGIRIVFDSLPFLRCDSCDADELPAASLGSIAHAYSAAVDHKKPGIRLEQQELPKDFRYCVVDFDYDPHDYWYIPGLQREHDPGYLTPVFFNKAVLIKFDNHPDYHVDLGSRTYGLIWRGVEYSIPFGINESDRVVLWLGDIDRLPEKEQHYLYSENVPSDHALGGEFYDAQVEAHFTEPSPEQQLLRARSTFHNAVERTFGVRLTHLDTEVLEVVQGFARPTVFTTKELKNAYDNLNKIMLESLDSASLGRLLEGEGISAKNLGTIKRLQKLLGTRIDPVAVNELMCAMYVTYDLRVAYLHLMSGKQAAENLTSARSRLSVPESAADDTLWDALVAEASRSFNEIARRLTNKVSHAAT